jgi:hypothetical protein
MPAPQLVAPGNGQLFKFDDTIVLQWQGTGPLPEDAYYVPIVSFYHKPSIWYDDTEWVKGTSWTLSDHDYLPGVSDYSTFNWSVRVMRFTGYDPATGRKTGIPLSHMSDEWKLVWQKP